MTSITLKKFGANKDSDFLLYFDDTITGNSETFYAIQNIYNALIDYVSENPNSYEKIINDIENYKETAVYSLKKIKKKTGIKDFNDNNAIIDKKAYIYLKNMIAYYSVYECDNNEENKLSEESGFKASETVIPYTLYSEENYFVPCYIEKGSKLDIAFNNFMLSTTIETGAGNTETIYYNNCRNNSYFTLNENKYYPFSISTNSEGKQGYADPKPWKTFKDTVSSIIFKEEFITEGPMITKNGEYYITYFDFIASKSAADAVKERLEDIIRNAAQSSEKYNGIKNGTSEFFSSYNIIVKLPYENNDVLKFYDYRLSNAVKTLKAELESESEKFTGEERNNFISALKKGYRSTELDKFINNSQSTKLKKIYNLIYKDGYVTYEAIETYIINNSGNLPTKTESQKYSYFANNDIYWLYSRSFNHDEVDAATNQYRYTKFMGDYLNRSIVSLEDMHKELLAYYVLYTCFYFAREENTSGIYYRKHYTIQNFNGNTTSNIPTITIGNSSAIYGSSDKDSMEKIYNALKKELEGIINNILTELANSLANVEEESEEETTTAESSHDYRSQDQYFNSVLANHIVEKDFYYINTISSKKHVPDTPFVDIQFKIPVVDSSNRSLNYKWVSVTNANGPSVDVIEGIDRLENGNMFHVESGSYFDGFTLKDQADGAKQITLNLRSVLDTNLEKIIINSMFITNGSYKLVTDNTNNSKNIATNENYKVIRELLNNANSHFRIRFGYRNMASGVYKNNVVDTDSASDPNFKGRNRKVGDQGNKYYRPTISYPWTYFMIKDFSSEILGDSNTYTISGQEVGQYLLDDLSLGGAGSELTFSETVEEDNGRIGTPDNVVSTIANYFYNASANWTEGDESPAVYILGKDDCTILTGWDGSQFESKPFKVIGEQETGLFSDLDFENYFYPGKYGENKKSKNFNVASDDNYSIISLRKLLDYMCDWLPERVYILKQSDNTVYAARIPYEDINKQNISLMEFFNANTHAIEKIKYQSIERKIELNGTEKNAVLIKFYFPGPKVNENNYDNDEPIRAYSYRATANPVIKEISFDNSITFSKAVSAITLLGDGVPLVFVNNNTEARLSSQTGANDKDVYFSSAQLKKINSAPTADTTSENPEDYTEALTMSASNYFKEMKRMSQTGTITILGDPFYYFDSVIQPGNFEIYLNINRIESYTTAVQTESFFSGVYRVLEIEHSFSKEGEFETKLKIQKEII